MRIICYLTFAFFFVACSTFKDKHKLHGNDVRLFKRTPVWRIAKAIESDDTNKIRQLLQGKSEDLINYREKRFGMSLLNWAVYNNHYPSTKVLAELGANPNLKSHDSTSAFIDAANKVTCDYLKLLLNYGGDVNAVADINAPEHSRTPLMAAANFNLESVKLLVNAGANANYIDSTSGLQSALLYAFYGGRINIVKYLIMDLGVDYKRAMGATIKGDSIYITYHLRCLTYPLESDEYRQKMELVDFLEEHGIDYWNAPIPKHYYKNYDSAYLEKY